MERLTWSYNQFKDILLNSNRRGSALSLSDFPQFIQLDHQFHGLLNGLRIATSMDGVERWALLGVKNESSPSMEGYGIRGRESKKATLMASDFIKGRRDHVPYEIIEKEIKEAERADIKFLLDIHSHPSDYLPLLLRFIRPFYSRVVANWAQFSPADLHRLVTPYDALPAMVLVASKSNLLAMRTRDTIDIPGFGSYITQDQFSDNWNGKFGLGINPIYFFLNLVDSLEHIFTPQALNISIAKEHKLVLYKGDVNEELMRIYPH